MSRSIQTAQAAESRAVRPAANEATRHVTLDVELTLFSESHFFAGLAGDVARGGLFVVTYRCLAVGTRVKVAYTLPGGERTIADGEVRWVRSPSDETDPGLAIAFDALGDEALAKISEFCKDRPPLYYDDERDEEDDCGEGRRAADRDAAAE